MRSIFVQKYLQKSSIAIVWVSFVDPASDRYSAAVPAIVNAISFYIGPRYNGSRL